MRPASLNDIDRAFEKTIASNPKLIRKLSVTNLAGFSDFDLDLHQPMVAICGSTGIGKSTILEMIRLIGEDAPSEIYGGGISRFSGATAKIEIGDKQGSSEHFLSFESQKRSAFDCEFIDLDSRTSAIQSLFRSVDLPSLKEGITQSDFDSKLRELCAFICGKNYDRISFFEIEVNDRISPLFEIQLPHRTYDSRTCSHGELSILYIAWALFYSDPKTFLIEEPESFLPPVAQGRVFYLLASAIIRHRHLIMFSTHAADLVEKMPVTALLPVKAVGQNSKILKDDTARDRILKKLGLQPKRLCTIYVEDNLAALVTQEILNRSNIWSLCRYEIRPHGESSGGIKKFADGLDQSFHSVCMVAVLDGDMRTTVGKWKNKEQIDFLPFENSMEAEFLEEIQSKIGQFAKLIGRTIEQVEDSLDAAPGADIHERFQQAAETLGISLETFGVFAFSLWAEESRNLAKCASLVDSLKSRVLTLPPT